ITVLRAVKANIASQFPTLLARGAHHGTPSKDDDVQRVLDMFIASNVLTSEAKRRIKGGKTDHAPDVMTAGAVHLATEKVVERWWCDRSFPRAQDEVYTPDP
ncbi:hypothetical protein OH77DRAFT_1413658, partial [Trametes cingulata]